MALPTFTIFENLAPPWSMAALDANFASILANWPSSGGGTVTSVGVASGNGFGGTVANATTTPVVTLTTTISGVLKGASSALAAAQPGVDFTAGTSALGTGILKSTTGTGVISIAGGADLPIMTATVGGAVPTPPNNTTTFLRGDGTFATPAGSGTVTASNTLTSGQMIIGGGTTVVTASKIAINQPATAGTITFGTDNATITLQGTDTYVGRATTDTLTNKRITWRVSATSGPGATPSMDTDNYDQFDFTALATAITSMTTNLTGTPNTDDWLVITFTDNGTARAITWGASFESSGNVTLPATTVISTKLTVVLQWNSVTSKWRCNGYA